MKTVNINIQQVRDRAYYLWLKDKTRSDEENWYLAEKQLKELAVFLRHFGHYGSYPPPTDLECIHTKAKISELAAQEKKVIELEEALKKAKAGKRDIEDDIARGRHPSAEQYKKIQEAKVRALMEAGDTEAMLELLQAQTAKAQKVVKSKGGRKSTASAVDKNWNPATPSRVPTGLQINCTTAAGKGKKASEELWTMGGHYKCPYNCNADRQSLAGAKKHFDKCARRPNFCIGENRAKEKCADTNYEMSDAEIEAYWEMLKKTSGKCGEDADAEFARIAPEPLPAVEE